MASNGYDRGMSERVAVTHAAGDYIKAIWTLSPSGPAGTSAIADALGLSPASVSNMLVRLREAGLIDYERYRGATLTDLGRREALRLIRRHRLIETFMIESLDYSWDDVHAEAEAIEHAISDRFAEQLASLLGDPSHDPHGDPIPDAQGRLPETPNTKLSDLSEGATLTVARLMTQDSAVLERLGALGIRPGTHVEVERPSDDDAPLKVRVQGQEREIDPELAELIRGQAP